jgi:hypothetical protein
VPYRQNWCARGPAAERWQDENVFWQESPTRSEGYRATKSYLKSSEFAAAFFVQVQLDPPIGTAG